MNTRWFRDRVAVTIALATLALHLAVAGRYDVFRDELYFIVCGRHPAFGYVDQPPLVPLLAAALYGLGHQTWLLRVPCAVAAAVLVVIVARFARLLRGGDAAAAAAGIAAATAPMFLGLYATFGTTLLEPLAWTAIAYALARAVLVDDRRAPIWAGVAAGVALEAKYAIISWLIALAVGLIVTRERTLLARRELWIGVALAAVIALPSIVWQGIHGWPFGELVHAARDKNVAVPPLAFLLNQVIVMNPVYAPLWLAGIGAPFIWRDLARVRFIAIAFVAVGALIIMSGGKDYYVASAYPAVFALGGVALERVVRSAVVRTVYLAVAVALSALVAPSAMPILPPAELAGYLTRLHLSEQKQEKSFAGTLLPQEFADQLGWRDFVRQVGTAYASLPPQDRVHTALVLGNYGEAAALDVYGAEYGLPPARSGHNQYYLWGPGPDVPNILRVERHFERLRRHCESVQVLGTTFSPYAMAYENGQSIVFCRHLAPPLATLWPDFKNYN